MKLRKVVLCLVMLGLVSGGTFLAADSTRTKSIIGKGDLKIWDGSTDNTFTRRTSTGGTYTLEKFDWVGVDVYAQQGARTSTAIAAAAGQVGTTNKASLFLSPGTWTLSADLTTASNITIVCPPGAVIDVETFTFTASGPFQASMEYCFDTTAGGSVSLAGGVVGGKIYPEWFGAVGDAVTDDQVAMQATFDSAGQNATVLLTNSYLIGAELSITTAGFTLKGESTGNSYFTSASRAKLHLICDFEEDTDALIFVDSLNGGMATIENINIDMAENKTMGIRNSTSGTTAQRAKMTIRGVNIARCGWHGIQINDGGNASIIEHVRVGGPDDYLSGNDFDTGVFVTGSIGFYINNCSDVIVTLCEAKGGFNYGMKYTGTMGVISENFFDQNLYGAWFLSGGRTMISSNRFQYNVTAGALIESSDNILDGNIFASNNSAKGLTYGSSEYDGSGVVLAGTSGNSYRNIFSSNILRNQLTGFKLNGVVTNCVFTGNRWYQLDDGALFDYTGGTGLAANYVYDHDRVYTFTGATQGIISTMSALKYTHAGVLNVTTGGYQVDMVQKALTADWEIGLGEGSFFKITPDASTWAVTLSSDFGSLYNGLKFVIYNNSATHTFTFEGTTVDTQKAYEFILIGGGLAPVIQ